jgi:aldehyde dehydrogenase (NAD+)
MPFRDNIESARRYGATYLGAHRIGAETVPVGGGERVVSRNPAFLDDIVGEFPSGGAAEVEAACAAARRAFGPWASTPAPVRGALLGRLARILEDRKEFLSRLVTREIGKPLREARGSVQEAVDTAQFFLSEGRRLYGQTVPSEMRHKELQTFRRPLGVCAMITAGNFPIAVPSWKILPAILCGNTVVWKPSEDAPTVAEAFAACLAEAGLPPGVLNVVHGTGAGAGAALVDAVDRGWVDKIAFTGSSAVGRRIGEVAGRNLQVPSLELGGKNPMIVLPDADLGAAVEAAVWAAYGTAGQRCTSLGNLILHEAIADRFVAAFVERARRLRIGDPSLHEDVDYGPLIAGRFLDRFLAHPGLGRGGAARPLLEGGRITDNAAGNFRGDAARGLYVRPFAWDHVCITDELAQTEVFGPTVNIIRVADFDEAIAAANGTPYGLSSAIYTNDPRLRLRFKNEIQAGMSSINNSTTGAEAHLPFGGVKASGNNTRESGIWVIDAYTRWHCVNIDDSGGLQLAQIETEQWAPVPGEDLAPLLPEPSPGE